MDCDIYLLNGLNVSESCDIIAVRTAQIAEHSKLQNFASINCLIHGAFLRKAANNINIKRHSLIFGLSYALDIAGKNNLSHSKSTAFLSVLIGRKIGLGEDMIMDLYYAALLHDIALSNTYEMIPHCIDGEKMLRKLPLSEEIAKIVLYHHEFYDGSGLFKLSGRDIPKSSQILCFASAFDDEFGRTEGDFDMNLYVKVCDWLDENKKKFSEEIFGAFEDLIKHVHLPDLTICTQELVNFPTEFTVDLECEENICDLCN